MTRVLALTLALAAALVAVLPAGAARRTKDLWATINVCDSEKYPNIVAIRASMPGDGARTRMYMRFSIQYYSRSRQTWGDVKGAGVSRWYYVGSGRYARRAKGWGTELKPPRSGSSSVVRGVVDFRWKKAGRTIRSARLNTKGGHPNTRGADPEGFSAGICEIRF